MLKQFRRWFFELIRPRKNYRETVRYRDYLIRRKGKRLYEVTYKDDTLLRFSHFTQRRCIEWVRENTRPLTLNIDNAGKKPEEKT